MTIYRYGGYDAVYTVEGDTIFRYGTFDGVYTIS